jgi:hypothetical protein
MCGRNMQVLPVINKSTIRALSQTGFGLALRDSASSDDKIRGGGGDESFTPMPRP